MPFHFSFKSIPIAGDHLKARAKLCIDLATEIGIRGIKLETWTGTHSRIPSQPLGQPHSLLVCNPFFGTWK